VQQALQQQTLRLQAGSANSTLQQL